MARRFLTLILADFVWEARARTRHGTEGVVVSKCKLEVVCLAVEKEQCKEAPPRVGVSERVSVVRRGRIPEEEGMSWPQPLRSCRGHQSGVALLWLSGKGCSCPLDGRSVLSLWCGLFEGQRRGLIKQARIPGPFFCDAGAGAPDARPTRLVSTGSREVHVQL